MAAVLDTISFRSVGRRVLALEARVHYRGELGGLGEKVALGVDERLFRVLEVVEVPPLVHPVRAPGDEGEGLAGLVEPADLGEHGRGAGYDQLPICRPPGPRPRGPRALSW